MSPSRTTSSPSLTEAQILAWADYHKAKTGKWPSKGSGEVMTVPGQMWEAVSNALRDGFRGLPGGDSLSKLLKRERARPVRKPRLKIGVIVRWAKEHHARTGEWPTGESGPVAGCEPLTWMAIDRALYSGLRGLPGGTSLSKALARYCGQIHRYVLRSLTLEEMLAWVDAFRARTGRWPTGGDKTKRIYAVHPPMMWGQLDTALKLGRVEGVKAGTTLPQCLVEHRQARVHRHEPRLTTDQVLAWADAHHARTGQWPTQASGPVPEAPDEHWSAVISALNAGSRGLPRLLFSQLLTADRPGVRMTRPRAESNAPLTVEQILAWADEHRARTGRWPTIGSGRVSSAPSESWMTINRALTRGLRGLPGDQHLAQLLVAYRQARLGIFKPALTVKQVLAWVDAHHVRTGEWPSRHDGPVTNAPAENWNALDQALRSGSRGLTKTGGLPGLLERHRGFSRRPEGPLTHAIILEWADEHFRRTGKWPHAKLGAVSNQPNEDWGSINHAMLGGRRGLPAGISLAKLLVIERQIIRVSHRPPLSIDQILAWADAHHARVGTWPNRNTGAVVEAPGENWKALDMAVSKGARGLPKEWTLPRLLSAKRGAPLFKSNVLIPLDVRQILKWADAWHRRTGQWPKFTSGPIPEAPGDTWSTVHSALRQGRRGLPGGQSLAEFLAAERQVVTRTNRPDLTLEQVLAWAQDHHRQTGRLPTRHDGPLLGVPGESWSAINSAIRMGTRGLPAGGVSLFHVLQGRETKAK